MVETIQGKSNDATACIDFKVQESIRAKYLVDTNDGKEAATWANREKDWYNAERRFIFACSTRKERDKWIELIIKDKINKGIKKGM